MIITSASIRVEVDESVPGVKLSKLNDTTYTLHISNKTYPSYPDIVIFFEERDTALRFCRSFGAALQHFLDDEEENDL